MNYPQGGNAWQQMPPPNMPPVPYPGPPFAPGYYAPPPKKKKTWLWILLALVTVIVVAVGGGIAFVVLTANHPATVTYHVTGTGKSAEVRYTVPGDNTAREDVRLPWTKELTFTGATATALILDAFPATGGDTVTCETSVNGKVVTSNTASDGSQAVCFGFTPEASRFR
ncbi:MmpS family transport accessory protein [Mycobacterium sp. DL440]|uniref:MmpS family transport accessory protein n=1 Tax=Mycobacterium sp. DL440 TaxID=2675523 RepID=UPI001422C3E0|nr:MmpS family transport accessory protein [Mycobacterium sp. DL440]